MKYLFLKITLILAFTLVNQISFAQQKDSVVIKPLEIKEEPNPLKKRKFVYLISDRWRYADRQL